MTDLSVERGLGLDGRDDAERHALPRLDRLRERIQVVGVEDGEVAAESAGARAAQEGPRRARCARVHPGLGPGALEHTGERRRDLRRVHDAVSAEARRGGHLPGQHRGQGRLVHLDDDALGVDPAAEVGEMVGHPFGQGLGDLAAGTVVGEQLVAARPLDGRGQRPRPRQLDLEDAVEVLGLLLELVEVLPEQGAGAPVVDAGRVGQPPARGLEVEAELGDRRERATDHAGLDAATGQLGKVGQVRSLAEDDPDRFGVLLGGGAGPRPDAGGDRHAGAPTRAVVTMVADPTTRVPS